MTQIPRPMLATPGGKPFTDAEWIFEIKWDGYRCMALVDHGQVKLQTRNGADATRWFPEVARSLAQLPGGPSIIDGEAVVLDDIGRSNFPALHERARRRRWFPGAPQVTLMAFDLLMHDGVDIRSLPLVERKARLSALLAGLPKAGAMYVGEFPAEAALFAEFVEGLQLEGFVAKRKTSAYTPGLSPDWVKIKRAGWKARRWT